MHFLVCNQIIVASLSFVHRRLFLIVPIVNFTSRRHNIAEKEIYKSSHVEIVGISPDPAEKQKEFVKKQNVPVRIFLMRSMRPKRRKLLDAICLLRGPRKTHVAALIVDPFCCFVFACASIVFLTLFRLPPYSIRS